MSGKEISYSIEMSRHGRETLLVRRGDREIYLHSRVRPERESELMAGRFDPERYDMLVVLGCGLGYHLAPVRELLGRYSGIVVIDMLPGIEKAIAGNDLTSFLAASDKVMIIAGKPEAEVIRALGEMIDMDSIRGISVLEHPASLRAFPEYYEGIRKQVEKLIHVKAGNKATKEAFGGRYIANILRNIRFLDGARPVSGLFGAFDGSPAVIAVSGPSLDRDIGLMISEQGRFFVVAVDSALPALRFAGIEPDLIISIDPQPYVREHFLGSASGGAPVVCSISSHPSVMRSGERFISLSTHPLAQLADEAYGGSIGTVDSATGSVAGDAVRLCAACGFSAIGVTGLDFSFLDFAIYARGTAYQKRYAAFFQDRATTVEGLNCRYILGASGGLKRGGRFTRKSFLQYRETLGDYLRRSGAGITLLNDRGLPPEGARILDFKAFIERHCGKPVPKKDAIGAVLANVPPLNAMPMRAALETVMEGELFDRLLDASLGRGAGDRQRARFRDLAARICLDR